MRVRFVGQDELKAVYGVAKRVFNVHDDGAEFGKHGRGVTMAGCRGLGSRS
jgi:hypothetical protein